MNRLRGRARFFAPRLFTQLSLSRSYITTHPATQLLPKADLQLTKRVAAGAQILQINFLDHIIVGQGYFSFQEAGVLGCQF
jgi:DNA repair protein RadC